MFRLVVTVVNNRIIGASRWESGLAAVGRILTRSSLNPTSTGIGCRRRSLSSNFWGKSWKCALNPTLTGFNCRCCSLNSTLTCLTVIWGSIDRNIGYGCFSFRVLLTGFMSICFILIFILAWRSLGCFSALYSFLIFAGIALISVYSHCWIGMSPAVLAMVLQLHLVWNTETTVIAPSSF